MTQKHVFVIVAALAIALVAAPSLFSFAHNTADAKVVVVKKHAVKRLVVRQPGQADRVVVVDPTLKETYTIKKFGSYDQLIIKKPHQRDQIIKVIPSQRQQILVQESTVGGTTSSSTTTTTTSTGGCTCPSS